MVFNSKLFTLVCGVFVHYKIMCSNNKQFLARTDEGGNKLRAHDSLEMHEVEEEHIFASFVLYVF